MKIIASFVIYNEEEYLYYSLSSIYDSVDKIIIIEGAWEPTYLVNGHKRSNDKTLDIVKEFPDQQNKIELHLHNEKTQLEQRNKIFDYLPKEDCIMFLVDADEVYQKEDLDKIRCRSIDAGTCVSFKSLIFVNDFYNFSEVYYPRLFKIYKDRKYKFIEPNTISENGTKIVAKESDIKFFHYSYVKKNDRFLEKKRCRTKVHGHFPWELNDGIVQRIDAKINPYNGKHPPIMESHPYFGIRKHKDYKEQEIIIYSEYSGIGNLILSTPMLQAIRKCKPNALLYLLCWPRSSRILDGVDFVDLIIDTNPSVFLGSIKQNIAHYIVSPCAGFYHPHLENVCANIHSMTVNQPWVKHESEYKMDIARKLGYVGESPLPKISLFDYNKNKANDFINKNQLGDFICINASYLKEDHWNRKHFGDQKFSELITKISNNWPKTGIVFIGDKSDFGNTERIISCGDTHDKVINACGISGDIKDTAAIIARSKAVIGNDGGLQHIASVLNIPTITIFLFTNIIKNMPLGKKSFIVAKQCMDRMMCQHNAQDIENKCRPRGCLNVDVDKVLEKINNAI